MPLPLAEAAHRSFRCVLVEASFLPVPDPVAQRCRRPLRRSLLLTCVLCLLRSQLFLRFHLVRVLHQPPCSACELGSLLLLPLR
jgi:hypothetical protein